MSQKNIYLDYNATTPCDPRVVEAMAPFFTEHFGNPASNHAYGWQAATAVEKTREAVAQLIHAANPQTITFTGSASEANNLAVKGVAQMYRTYGKHLITQKTEHASVLESFKSLEENGFTVTYLNVDRH